MARTAKQAAGKVTDQATSRPHGRAASDRVSKSVSKSVAEPVPARHVRARAERQAERRRAILDAALDEFAAAGFAAARLDDVAKRAGVAKGTIYLYFRDKESLFHELVRSMLSPIVGRIVAAP